MGFENHSIPSDEFHPTSPVLRTPLSKPPEEDIFIEKIVENVQNPSIAFKHRFHKIPQKICAFFNDPNLMLLLTNFFGVASQVYTLVGEIGTKFVPLLSIASSPFYLRHAIKDARQRFKLMATAFKTSRVADGFFYGTKGTNAFGIALNELAKPFAGGAALFGLTHIPAVAMTFSIILPILLMIFGAIGGMSQGWALKRTADALKEFKSHSSQHLDGSLEGLEEMLLYLQGPVKHVAATDKLDMANFNEHYFTNNTRRVAIQKRLENLLNHHDLHLIRSVQEQVESKDVKQSVDPLIAQFMRIKTKHIDHHELEETIELFTQMHELYEKLLNPDISNFQRIELTISLFDKLIVILEDKFTEYEHQNLCIEFSKDLKQQREELITLKNTLLQEGYEIVDSVHSEIHRKLCEHTVYLLMAVITLAAGVLYISSPHYFALASYLTLASSGISVLYILFDKSISHKRFLEMERFLRMINKHQVLNREC